MSNDDSLSVNLPGTKTGSPLTVPALLNNASLSDTDTTELPSVTQDRKDLTAEKIKQYILKHGLSSADPLPAEQQLCKDLGVSRSSVREALRRLEALSIVSVKKGRGSFVGELSMEPLVETMAFRALLETHSNYDTLLEVVQVRRYLDLGVADDLCSKLQGTTQPGLMALVKIMEGKASKNEPFYEEDFAFHDILLSLGENHVVRQLVTSFWSIHNVVVPMLHINTPHSLDQTATAHGEMLLAAQRGDVSAYEKAVYDHYRPLENILLTLKTQNS